MCIRDSFHQTQYTFCQTFFDRDLIFRASVLANITPDSDDNQLKNLYLVKCIICHMQKYHHDRMKLFVLLQSPFQRIKKKQIILKANEK